jgi:hypothetical protein
MYAITPRRMNESNRTKLVLTSWTKMEKEKGFVHYISDNGNYWDSWMSPPKIQKEMTQRLINRNYCKDPMHKGKRIRENFTKVTKDTKTTTPNT